LGISGKRWEEADIKNSHSIGDTQVPETTRGRFPLRGFLSRPMPPISPHTLSEENAMNLVLHSM